MRLPFRDQSPKHVRNPLCGCPSSGFRSPHFFLGRSLEPVAGGDYLCERLLKEKGGKTALQGKSSAALTELYSDLYENEEHEAAGDEEGRSSQVRAGVWRDGRAFTGGTPAQRIFKPARPREGAHPASNFFPVVGDLGGKFGQPGDAELDFFLKWPDGSFWGGVGL